MRNKILHVVADVVADVVAEVVLERDVVLVLIVMYILDMKI